MSVSLITQARFLFFPLSLPLRSKDRTVSGWQFRYRAAALSPMSPMITTNVRLDDLVSYILLGLRDRMGILRV
jgi:hypothetical protein